MAWSYEGQPVLGQSTKEEQMPKECLEHVSLHLNDTWWFVRKNAEKRIKWLYVSNPLCVLSGWKRFILSSKSSM